MTELNSDMAYNRTLYSAPRSVPGVELPHIHADGCRCVCVACIQGCSGCMYVKSKFRYFGAHLFRADLKL